MLFVSTSSRECGELRKYKWLINNVQCYEGKSPKLAWLLELSVVLEMEVSRDRRALYKEDHRDLNNKRNRRFVKILTK